MKQRTAIIIFCLQTKRQHVQSPRYIIRLLPFSSAVSRPRVLVSDELPPITDSRDRART